METTLHYLAFDEIGITVAVIATALAFVVLAWNAVKAIHDWRTLARRPTSDTLADHEQRIKSLENCCEEVRGKLQSDWQWQRSADEINTLMLRSIKGLLEHAIDDNNVAKLKGLDEEVENWLFDHRDR